MSFIPLPENGLHTSNTSHFYGWKAREGLSGAGAFDFGNFGLVLNKGISCYAPSLDVTLDALDVTLDALKFLLVQGHSG